MQNSDHANVYRILDANANRAREALRVAEEAARFALERPDLAEALKRLRHDLRAALARLDSHQLLSARDTAGDVGTAISTAS
jgi:thiamine-phosphate pyrophosphorylase